MTGNGNISGLNDIWLCHAYLGQRELKGLAGIYRCRQEQDMDYIGLLPNDDQGLCGRAPGVQNLHRWTSKQRLMGPQKQGY